MKICIVTHCVIRGDGQGRVNYEVVREALRQGHHLTLVASAISPELAQHPQVTWVPIVVKQISTALLRNVVFSLKSSAWLRQHQAEFDVVKVNGAIASGRSDLNAVHFVHSSWLKSPFHVWHQRRDLYGAYQWLYTALNAYWEKAAFDRAKLVVAVSEKVKREILALGIPAERIEVITNGVDLEEFSPARVDRRELGLPEDVLLALFVGDLRVPRKNLDTVLHALVNVPQLHLAIAGAADGRNFYPQLAQKLGVSDRVHFLGFRSDVADLMRSADLFVFPSRYEACSLVLLEAMASQLPLITATSAGGAEIMTPECGFVLDDPDEVDTLSSAMNHLVKPEARHQMGKAARSIAERSSWTQMARRYLEMFEEVREGIGDRG
ncbi:glycosyltransferase family 4 protein [Chamaesiphon sp. GL140_3_metabinner_50]|uniref:glycosyltransferase family 4 protein n=1 Tax=Chamaesiphon sp. GL140_3_metabinner_50 TaxID=2970812 RepID=UPI0025E2E50B|nr:glycosyltransferase family 4 protein [Chamaesiphon sp. GL140_3_metabinner_50]